MKISSKAALLSAFVFPGVGHFYLKKMRLGFLFSGVAVASLYVLISNTIEKAVQIAEQIQRGEASLDITEITAMVSAQTMGSEMQFMNIATGVFIFCWLLGIVDAYRIGRSRNDVSV